MPAPTVPPPTATAAPTTVAMIEEVSSANSTTLPVPRPLPAPVVTTWLPSIDALALVRITLVDTAPAPARPMPATEPMPTASEAATDRAVIEPSRNQRLLSA